MLTLKVLDKNNQEIDLRQTQDEDDDIGLPPPALPDDFEAGDISEGFGIEDESGELVDDVANSFSDNVDDITE